MEKWLISKEYNVKSKDKTVIKLFPFPNIKINQFDIHSQTNLLSKDRNKKFSHK